jgi:hypothetical protein
MDGSSALTQLAIFREYVASLRAHHVIWFFYEGNDIGDYLLERTWPLLSAYLEHGYLQGLVRLNDLISLAMKRFIDQRLGSVDVAALEYAEQSGNLKATVDFLLLRRAREAFRLVRIPKLPDLAETSGARSPISGVRS